MGALLAPFLKVDAASRLSPFQKKPSNLIKQYTKKHGHIQRRSYYPRSRRSRDYTTRVKPSSTNFSRQLSLRRPKMNEGVRTSLLRTTKEQYQTVSAENIPFYMSVPKDFVKVSDTLNWNGGTLRFSRDSAAIEVISLGERCDGGTSFVRQCLSDKSRSLNQRLHSQFPQTNVVEDKNMFLRGSVVQPNKRRTARYFVLQNRVEKIVQLTFLEPVNNFLWTLKMRAPRKGGAVLNDNIMQRVIVSLFQKGPRESKVVRPQVITRQRPIIQRKYSRPFKLAEVQRVKADNIPFEIKVPTGFKKMKDTLNFDSGEMLFRKDESSIRIISTAVKCNFQTHTLIRKCVERQSRSHTDELTFETLGLQMLRDENILSQMTFKQKSNKDIGRLFLARVGKSRNAIYTFHEPVTHHVWRIEMEAPEGKDELLNDMRKIRKVISSIFYRSE